MFAGRPTLNDISYLGRGVLEKVHKMLYQEGPGNGTFLALPFDQLVEHGPGHEFKWERSAKPESVIELAKVGPFSALVLSVGQAQKYQLEIAPSIPLIVKLDGHFYTGKANESNYPRHTMFGTIEEALKVGASAVGLTFYLGSEETGADVERIAKVREEVHNCGVPLILWSYPRGPAPDATKGDSLLWCHYAVSAAESIGADIVKTKFPSVVEPEKRKEYEQYIRGEYSKKIPEAERYLELEPPEEDLIEYARGVEAKGEKPNYDSLLSKEEHIERAKTVVGAGTRTFVIFSGGPKVMGDAKEALVETTEIIMEAGGEGRIIGRNFWGIPIEEGLELAQAVAEVMKQEKYER